MDHTILATELATDPAVLGYAQHLAECPGLVVELLNAPTQTGVCSRYVTARGILAEVDGGAQILDKLEALAAVVPEVKWAMRFMVGDTGVDIGHAKTRGLLTALASQGAITQGEAAALLGLAVQPCSRAQALGLPPITEADVRLATGAL